MSTLENLSNEAANLSSLINEANSALDEPVSNLRKSFVDSISNSNTRNAIAYQFSRCLQSGDIRKIVAGGAMLGAAFVGAAGIDFARNTISKAQARNAIAGYYRELAVKNGLIIQEYRKLLNELHTNTNLLQAERDELQAKCDKLDSLCTRITEVLQKQRY